MSRSVKKKETKIWKQFQEKAKASTLSIIRVGCNHSEDDGKGKGKGKCPKPSALGNQSMIHRLAGPAILDVRMLLCLVMRYARDTHC